MTNFKRFHRSAGSCVRRSQGAEARASGGARAGRLISGSLYIGASNNLGINKQIYTFLERSANA
jgi:hypothetical protein